MTANDNVKEYAAKVAQSPDIQVSEAISELNFNNVSLPPGLAAMHGKSSVEILATLNKTPLFMTELEENDELEAFKALAYEGTPLEISRNFKERGNECFQERKWADAKEFYTKGIQVLQTSQREREHEHATKIEKASETEETAEQQEQDPQAELALLEALLLNRAAANLPLQNYRSTVLDCAAALRLNPQNLKAHHRSAKALLALNYLSEASAILTRGLSLSPANPALVVLAKEVRDRETEMVARKEKAAKVVRERERERDLLTRALKRGGVKMRRTARPPEMGDVKVCLAPLERGAGDGDGDDDNGDEREILFPVLLLYPLELQSDIITAFPASTTLRQHLDDVLSPPPTWDMAGVYTIKGVECFMETILGGLIKVGRNIPLLEVLGRGDVEVVDEVVRIYILPKSQSMKWAKEFKERSAAGKGQGG